MPTSDKSEEPKSNKSVRGAPAFQMYAPDRLANRAFRAMSAAERGLLHTIELECWVNGNVPADVRGLARTLGMEQSEVKEALTDRVLLFLELQSGPEEIYIVPDLEKYRRGMLDRKERMSNGGKAGAEKVWRNKKPSNPKSPEPDGVAIGVANGEAIRVPDGPLSGAEVSGEERNGVVFKTTDIHDDFIRDMEGDPEFMCKMNGRRG